MKRAGAPNASENPPQKRTKASQACASCRKQKSRCEILDVRPVAGAPVVIRCHRCKVLGVECSFETSDLIHFAPKAVSASTPSSDASSPGTSTTLVEPTSSYSGLGALAAAAAASSLPTPIPPPLNTPTTIPARFGIAPEDLVPNASTPVWGPGYKASRVSRVDWTAAPMLAIQEMVRCPKIDQPIDIPSAARLSDILSGAEITSLLDIFETRYSPWLGLPPARLNNTNSLFDIVRCTIASRQLPLSRRSSAAPRLQKLTEDVFVSELFNPQPSLDSIRALLILSVWTPISGTGAEARDGRLLIASAVSMAMNLQLQNESKRVIGLRAEKPQKMTEIDESTHKWRLWMSLAVVESALCVGTGRTPVSHLSPLDHDMTALSSFPEFTLLSVRDIRLGLAAKVLHVCESALQLRLQRVDNLETFFNKMNDLTYTMEGMSRLIKPLYVLTPLDTFYSQMLLLEYHACLVLIYHHALREVRTTYERDAPDTPWYSVETKAGHCISLFWGREALINAEGVLTTFLSVTDPTLFSSAPDIIFIMIGFAATWIFVSNFTLYQMAGSNLGGPSEMLQTLTIERLHQIALSPDHAATRCGHVLAALMTAWEKRKPAPRDPEMSECFIHVPYTRTNHPQVQRGPYIGTQATEATMVPDLGVAIDPLGPFPDLGGAEINWDLFMDDVFWSTFMENLNSDAGSVPVVPLG
ncbi:hypothetical protein MIND_01199900 [Mycena indigotica]|uniref:Zn(2)-C6 fungal-type domain-containing protein n=1 Tax=Mycena indigotica TaxID=2126181 RepID=A0A8H6S6J4_9AGAR|nr:uncharacterized protein MIND_01199900 [Mycena indigotica]KAF7293006.1 hypothetical protein MIND_01199900 [Mycena indigotica]